MYVCYPYLYMKIDTWVKPKIANVQLKYEIKLTSQYMSFGLMRVQEISRSPRTSKNSQRPKFDYRSNLTFLFYYNKATLGLIQSILI